MSRMVLLQMFAVVVVGLGCSDGGDESKKATGELCQENTDCADVVCHEGLCAAGNPLEIGESCASKAQCKSYVCTTDICTEGTKPQGTRCIHDLECGAGSCQSQVCLVSDNHDMGHPDAGMDGPIPVDSAPPDVAVDTAPPDTQPPPDVSKPDTGVVYFFDDFTTGLGQWTCGTGWGTTNKTYNSGPVSITDTPSGDYLPGADSDCRLTKSLDLSMATAPMLTFFHKYTLWSAYNGTSGAWYLDKVKVEVSQDGGFTWALLKEYSKMMSTWSFEQIDLKSHIGTKVKIRFRLMSLAASPGADGWYIDDVRIEELP